MVAVFGKFRYVFLQYIVVLALLCDRPDLLRDGEIRLPTEAQVRAAFRDRDDVKLLFSSAWCLFLCARAQIYPPLPDPDQLDAQRDDMLSLYMLGVCVLRLMLPSLLPPRTSGGDQREQQPLIRADDFFAAIYRPLGPHVEVAVREILGQFQFYTICLDECASVRLFANVALHGPCWADRLRWETEFRGCKASSGLD